MAICYNCLVFVFSTYVWDGNEKLNGLENTIELL